MQNGRQSGRRPGPEGQNPWLLKHYAVSSHNNQDPASQLITPYREPVPNNPMAAGLVLNGVAQQSPVLDKMYGDGVVPQPPISIGMEPPLPRTYSRNPGAWQPSQAVDALANAYTFLLGSTGRSPAEGGRPFDASVDPRRMGPSPLSAPPPPSVEQGMRMLWERGYARARDDAFVTVHGDPIHAGSTRALALDSYYRESGSALRPMMPSTDLGVLAAAAPPPTLPAEGTNRGSSRGGA